MKKIKKVVLSYIKYPRLLIKYFPLIGLSLLFIFLSCGSGKESPINPVSNDGARWRIAYYQGGNYIDYAQSLAGIIGALNEYGWIKSGEIPDFSGEQNTEIIWDYLVHNANSKYMEFPPDAFYSADWDDVKRIKNRQLMIDRLNQKNDIDLVIAMGTWAGLDLANDKHKTPTIVISTSDPIEAGIISSADDSGYEHILVEVDPDRYRRQIRMFHDIVQFNNLGVVFKNSKEGRAYSNIPDIEYVAVERGFKLVECFAEEYPDDQSSVQAVVDCYETIAPRIDALWIGAHLGENTKFMPQSLNVLFENNIPTWASVGPAAVKRGVLLSSLFTDYSAAGRWYVTCIGRIFHGTSPREIDPIFEMPGRIVVNLETARRIGFKLPEGILKVADTVYETIEGE